MSIFIKLSGLMVLYALFAAIGIVILSKVIAVFSVPSAVIRPL